MINNSHFVLIVGYESDDKSGNSTLYVNDPYYDTDSYGYEQISDIILYYVVTEYGESDIAPPITINWF